MAYDRNLLKPKQIEGFKAWLDENQLVWRHGKGQNQALQVKLKDSWTAISVSESNVVTTSPSLREMIAHFNKGLPYTAKPQRTDQPDTDVLTREQASEKQAAFLEDLRDDFAMRAMQAWLGAADFFDCGDSNMLKSTAEFSYRMADAMLEARKVKP